MRFSIGLVGDDEGRILEGIGYTTEKVLAWFSSMFILGYDSDDSNLDRCYEVEVSYPKGKRPDVLLSERIKLDDIDDIRTENVVGRIIKEKIINFF